MKLLALLPLLLLSGCVHYITLDANSSEIDYARADDLLRGRNAAIRLVDSTKIIGQRFRFYPDSLVYANFNTGGDRWLPADSISRVMAIDQWSGAKQGALIGALPGSILGTLIMGFITSVSMNVDDGGEPTSNWWIPVGTLVGAGVGAIIGGAIGANSGPTYYVIYSPRYL